ncbi:MAG: RuBisCO large subunit C-terminal-like domain-containing protein [Desulfobacterota bacterium]|nr:RuBisCO large subunit C-terminal-like domain-containing protein [Thermodesulfobacteriota bacterium]
MGTEIIKLENKSLFVWQDFLKSEEYLVATYYVETAANPEFTAIAIAMEQSATTTQLAGFKSFNLSPYTARVVSVKVTGEVKDMILPPYRLNTGVYRGNYKKSGYYSANIKIAFPVINFGSSLTNLWNGVGGELYRIGFINTAKILDIKFPESYLINLKGPLFGVQGIREKFKIKDRPILVRSTRPAVGLGIEEMAEINYRVLKGGFDGVKDDELTVDNSIAPFKKRVNKMVDIIKRVEDETGEKKFYLANIIDDPLKTLKLARIAAKAGVDSLMVAPAIQGLRIAQDISMITGLPVLSHNSWMDFLTRPPKFGVNESLMIKIQRLCGADMVILPGNFATEFAHQDQEENCILACKFGLDNILPTLPVLAGGKSSEHFKKYCEKVGSPDFMLIVATAVDTHPSGIEAGAKAFREAWKLIKNKQH